MNELAGVKRGVDELRNYIIQKEPAHFSEKDILDAFFGALLFGINFAIKGLLLRVMQAVTAANLIIIIVFTLTVLTAEIYFIGYTRVTKKSERKFGQFWLKRLTAFYCISLITATFLVFLFRMNTFTEVAADPLGIIKLIVLISLPCALGASVSDLIKKY